MGRIRSLAVILVALQFPGPILRAQSSIDYLKAELKEAQQAHEDATSKQLNDLISALDKALQSPDDALQLYQDAGGDMPDPAPVIKLNESETPDEKALRDAQDQAVNAALAAVVQLHCGVMRFAAYYIKSPDQKGLHDSWVAWLKQAAQTYAQTGVTPPDTRVKPPAPDQQNQRQNQRDNDPDKPPAPKPKKKAPGPDYVRILKDKAVRDSVISTYLGYNGWGDKEQGGWSVRDIPHFYRTEILEPLRTNPGEATLSAWDAYIAMKSADQPDRDKWNNVDYPALQFQRGCDDFYATPSDEKIETLVNLISKNPTNPDLDDWISQVKQLIQDYSTFKSNGTRPHPGDGSTNAAPAAPTAPVAPVHG